MQRFNLTIIILALFLMAAFSAGNTLTKTVVLAFAMPIFFVYGYLNSLKFTVILFGLAVFLLCGMILMGLKWLDAVILSVNFLTVVLAAGFCRGSFRASLENCRENLENLDGKFSQLKEEDLKILQGNKKLEDKVNGIEDLYEITKDMSVALDFDKIFAIFQDVLKKRFEFKICSLIYIEKTGENVYKIGKILRIFEDSLLNTTKAGKMDDALFECFLTEKERMLVIKNQDVRLKEKFNLPREANAFIAVPLIVEKELMGILSMEDLKEEDFEKFIIVAGQFALEMKKAMLYEKVEELALTDGLTGLFVRRHFLKCLKEEIERSMRHKLTLALIMIDIDNFKRCNDNYGHLVGDVVLKEIAVIIKGNTREVDLAGRYGGEEFCVALPETDKEGSMQVAERIRNAVENRKISAYGENVHVTISVGLATYPKDEKEMTELIQTADEALYAAKRGGKNKIVVYGEGK